MQQHIHDDQQKYIHACSQQLRMRTDLSHFRQALLNTQLVDDTDQIPTALQRFQQWYTDDTIAYPSAPVSEEDRSEIAHCSKWGSVYTDLLYAWLTTLRWPNAPSDDDPGISWLELLVNFELTTQHCIPLQFLQDGATVYRDYTDVRGWTRAQCNIHDYICSFQASITHLEKLLRHAMLPIPRGKVKSVYQLGAGAGHRGVLTRPNMLWTSDTMELVNTYLLATRGKEHSARFTMLPEIPVREPSVSTFIQPLAGDTPAKRHQRFQQRMASQRGAPVNA
eukprot:Skav228892  [mRNA]  locus=scaffold194:260316:261152:- [translate_table: standard]